MRLIVADRTKRVKEARDEAKKEIDAYKKEKDDEFKKFESEVCLAFPASSPLAYRSTLRETDDNDRL